MGVLQKILSNDYVSLAKFMLPLAFTDVAVDIGEQFLNRSVAHSANVVETLAAFGLAYVIIKLFVGVVEEVKQVGVVLVQDRPGFHKILVCVVLMGGFFLAVAVLIAETQLGVWLFEDLHGVSCSVGKLTHQALLYLSAYPLIHAVSWLHGGVLLQHRHSVLVGVASLSDIIAQIASVAVLLWTPLICSVPLAVPILAAYCGILTRCTVTLVAFYCKVYPKLSKDVTHKVTVWRLASFTAPLMFVLAIQRSTRPMLNLLAAHFAPSKADAALTVAVLTASYPVGHIVYGWLNQVRPISPTFQKKSQSMTRKLIPGKKIAFFVIGALSVSVVLSFSLLWLPGVSLWIMEHIVGVPHKVAVLSVNPLRVFAFFCFTVSVRASLTGWLTMHQKTKFVTPSGFIRVSSVLVTFFTLYAAKVGGALQAVLALYSGFFSEMVSIGIISSLYACWRANQESPSLCGPHSIQHSTSALATRYKRTGRPRLASSVEQDNVELLSLEKEEEVENNTSMENDSSETGIVGNGASETNTSIDTDSSRTVKNASSVVETNTIMDNDSSRTVIKDSNVSSIVENSA